jgi:hypothetical protein
MLNALLTGLNRALPFTKSDIPSFDEHVNCLFKIVHVSPLSTSVQSLTLLYQVMESHHSVSSRYYRALYRKVTDVELTTSTGKQVGGVMRGVCYSKYHRLCFSICCSNLRKVILNLVVEG